MFVVLAEAVVFSLVFGLQRVSSVFYPIYMHEFNLTGQVTSSMMSPMYFVFAAVGLCCPQLFCAHADGAGPLGTICDERFGTFVTFTAAAVFGGGGHALALVANDAVLMFIAYALIGARAQCMPTPLCRCRRHLLCFVLFGDRSVGKCASRSTWHGFRTTRLHMRMRPPPPSVPHTYQLVN
jgi:hypothetical protein